MFGDWECLILENWQYFVHTVFISLSLWTLLLPLCVLYICIYICIYIHIHNTMHWLWIKFSEYSGFSTRRLKHWFMYLASCQKYNKNWSSNDYKVVVIWNMRNLQCGPRQKNGEIYSNMAFHSDGHSWDSAGALSFRISHGNSFGNWVFINFTLTDFISG